MRPRIRSLKPELWADEKIGALSRDARLLLLGMVTVADDEGRFRARRSELIGSIFPADDDAFALIDGWIGEVKDQGIVVFYIVDSVPYGAFRHWRRHQKINKPTPSILPPPPDRKILRENAVPTKVDGTDNSGSAHGALQEMAGSSHSPTRTRALRSDPILIRSLLNDGTEKTEPQRALLLSALLAAWITRNDPKAKPDPESDRWVTDMRRLLGDRDGDVSEIAEIIDWCQADGFWRGNILSPGKLRAQFTQLALKARGGHAAGNVHSISRRDRVIAERGDYLNDYDQDGRAAS